MASYQAEFVYVLNNALWAIKLEDYFGFSTEEEICISAAKRSSVYCLTLLLFCEIKKERV